MNVITIESDAFKQIMDKLQRLDNKFVELKMEADTPLSEKWIDNQEAVMLLKTSKKNSAKQKQLTNLEILLLLTIESSVYIKLN